ncbi:dolichyl-phosphate-mannose--protein mannosyltransferase [Allobranchiibius sp. GilTou73]|uniref:dolichyl-phosphate-mannose--protein mannosyltransferase n=1 Tax=Allobranchiibius sp. GilTou73 TaxID=2904523 RepID=UPI001F3AC1C3|nr:phospholipid carrier-dependent glycosyltransferase [Allobranchiibius sp. GilTou73]UIJ34873.1 phospholipid carrier-dependent glycosyltransferase [Allobranchiibius sp. GilTou73]
MIQTLVRPPRRTRLAPTRALSTTEQLRRRLLGRPRTAQEKLWGWLGPAMLTVVGGILRFWNVGRPHQLIFDETYYVKEGWSLMRFGYERKQDKTTGITNNPDSLFTMGNPHIYGANPDFVVHPPMGKWLIGLGESLFGINSSFGWRFAVAATGTLSIYLVGRAAWHLFRSPLLATIASLLLCFEGSEFVMSRTGILDIMVMFWALAGFVALLADRARTRGILARKVAAMKDAGTWDSHDLAGPWLGWRPWRWVAAVCLGLDVATKWSGGYYLAVFCVMSVLWDVGARRSVGVRRWISATFIKDALPAAVYMVAVAVGTYLITWIGWFSHPGAYDRQWAADNPAVKNDGISPDSHLFAWLPDPLRSLWQYNVEMYKAALSITQPHPYESNPWSWMLQTRPTSFFYESPPPHECGAAQCSKAITSLGNVGIWWFGTVALAVLLFCWLLRRDWRAGAIWGGVAAGWFPWFEYQQRTIFTFYSVVFSPYVVLACVFVLGLMLGPVTADARRVLFGKVAVGGYLLLVTALFIFFWPIWTGQVIPQTHWQWRMWFPSWV